MVQISLNGADKEEALERHEYKGELPVLFDRIRWRDPVTGRPLEPIILARTPAGVPICGALKVAGTSFGYPIVDCVVRLTPELAHKYQEWLTHMSLEPPEMREGECGVFQPEFTVDSFGWQWHWSNNMRSEADLRMRVVDRFQLDPRELKDLIILDAGAGAGDQSRYLLQHGAEVVSVDLSSAIDVVAGKLRMHPGWIGVQGDVTALPFTDAQFDIVYCEGVIQHTQDSVLSVRELCRVAKAGGRVLASHYVRSAAKTTLRRLRRKVTLGYYNFLRNRLTGLDRYKLMLFTGTVAALSYVPLLGKLLRLSGTALYYDLMPDFKTTWTNTFDFYGKHAFQRFVTPEEFWGYFEDAGNMELILKDIGVVVARKHG
jgi:ubiquinone/menaquinone biosynthesis C-methylase UbiE